MKKFILPLFIICTNFAWASQNQLPPKSVMVPFTSEISSPRHFGLSFYYDLKATPAKKVVCNIDHTYKSWFEFRDENGVIRESAVFGGHQTVIFVNKGKSGDIDQNTSIYKTAIAGGIKIFNIEKKSTQATASCHYEIDNAN